MTYSRESVYTYVRNALVAAHNGIYVTARREPVTKTFPAVRIIEMNRQRTEQYATLANDDDQYVSTIETEVFSNKRNGAVQEAYAVQDTLEAAFKRLGYFETFSDAIDNIDPSVFRVVSRFTKQIGLGDTLPNT
jgi:hypothetical protein